MELGDIADGIDEVELLEIEPVHEHRGAPSELAQPRWQGVEPRADHGLHRWRKRRMARRLPSLGLGHEHAGRLDDEKGIAAGALGDLDRLRIGDVTAARMTDEVNRLLSRQRN